MPRSILRAMLAKPEPNHPDLELIACRWHRSIEDGTFGEWFEAAYPKPRWHWILLLVLSSLVCLFPIAIVLFVGRVKRRLERWRLKRFYVKHGRTGDVRLAYCWVGMPVELRFGLLDDDFGYSRALVPADRVLGEYGWDSGMVNLIEELALGPCWRLDSKGKALREHLDSGIRLDGPFRLPDQIASGREIWVIDLPKFAVQGLLKDPGGKPLVLPCLLRRGDFAKVLPLPQFLIHDFREIDQRFRKEFPGGRQIFAQMLETVPREMVIKDFVEYLAYEDKDSFSPEEHAIFTVHEVEPYVRSEGLELAIAAYGIDETKRWIDGLSLIGAASQHQEARRILPFLDELARKFGDRWEYDDVVFEVDGSFPGDVNYAGTMAFDVDQLLYEFALANVAKLR